MKESMDQEISWYEDAWRRGQVRGRGRGQGNFKLAANFGYNSRGSADPRESLRKRRILKLALSAHKVLRQRNPGACRCVLAKKRMVDIEDYGRERESLSRRSDSEKGKYGER